MHDIDFDEIDRAINSVKNPRQTANTATSSDSRALSTPDTTSASITTTHTASALTAPSTPVPSPAARRSSGRFMDVVHPSSDMRPSGSSRPTPTPASIFHHDAPVRAQVAERPEPTVQPPVFAPAPPAPIESGESAASEEPESPAFHWPDPIDLQESAQQDPTPEVIETLPMPDDEVIAENVVIPEDSVDDDEDEDINAIIAAPLESPFLSDAKVEKRPLGAFSGPDTDLPLLEDFPAPNQQHEPAVPTTPSEAVEVTKEPEVHVEKDATESLHADEARFESDLEVPPELHPDLLMLDTHSQDEEVPELLAASAPAVEDVPSGPTSITQQYKEQPTTVDQTPGAIFDTATYHQALTHPPKKRSSILIIVWIVAIILVGGGLGLGFYLVALPMLG